MSDTNKRARAAATSPMLVMERTYRASANELWEMWTTKEGFESWWPPEGVRTEVHAIEACPNGRLQYDMIAETPAVVSALKEMGLPISHLERARFSEFRPLERLVLSIMMDFLPGVEPYESSIMVDFFPNGEWVRMVVTLNPLHNEEFTKLAGDTLVGQLTNLEKRLLKSSEAATGFELSNRRGSN